MSTLTEIMEERDEALFRFATTAPGPAAPLPFTREWVTTRPSGDVFGWSQNVGMGLEAARLGAPEFLLLSTQGGLRNEDGSALALGYHTGHWELGLLTRAAAEELRRLGGVAFAGYCSDPCDGRTQGTPGMMDSLAYRNDAAIVLRRLIRSLPTRHGVMGIASCDKGAPAMLMALAGSKQLPGIFVPGGVMLAPEAEHEDTGKVQTLGVRVAHGLISLEEAAEMGCHACASPGGGCQFLGTAATSQVVAEALGLTVPHAALAPSGQPVWLAMARASARALVRLAASHTPLGALLTETAVQNAMVVHAAFGGSTNLLLHIPAIAHAAHLRRPTVADWTHVNRHTPRLVDVLPNGPRGFATVYAYQAGGVPEVMLHLEALGLLDTSVQTAAGVSLSEVLAWWRHSARRTRFRQKIRDEGVDPDLVIYSPDRARQAGLTSTVTFPVGNLAPQGSVIKSTAIAPTLLDAAGVYHKQGPARVFTSERAAMAAIKSQGADRIQPGDILVLMGRGPQGSGMEEVYQITAALRYLPWGAEVAVITDARFSGVSTGACIGHVGPEALAGGPLGKLRDGDLIEIRIDTQRLEGSLNFIGEAGAPLSPEQGAQTLARRRAHPDLAPDADLPEDTQLWALLQAASGGTWGGCVFDLPALRERLMGETAAVAKPASESSEVRPGV